MATQKDVHGIGADEEDNLCHQDICSASANIEMPHITTIDSDDTYSSRSRMREVLTIVRYVLDTIILRTKYA